ncbi:MAG: TauD/TfdA family dioxygenase [Usitatibacter sp.]
MNAVPKVACAATEEAQRSVFSLAPAEAWARWRDRKLASRPRDAADLVVEVRDPRKLTRAEHEAIVERCRRSNMAIYASRVHAGSATVLAIARQLGLGAADASLLAGKDAVARIAADTRKAAAGFIPYTRARMRWHTDGYYNPPDRRVRAMLLHCVHDAACGGETALLDPELAWLRLSEAGVELVRALMSPDALTIPARTDRSGVARAAVSGPVFAVEPESGDLHMRYTARRRSVQWRCDATAAEAAARLLAFMDSDTSCVIRVRLEPGMGLVCNNVLHERAAFEDAADHSRLLLRARFLDRIAGTSGAWARLAAP